MNGDQEEIRQQVLQTASELYASLEAQQHLMGRLSAVAQIVEFARATLEPLARQELEEHRQELVQIRDQAQRAVDTAWRNYEPHARKLSRLEGKYAEAMSFRVQIPDIVGDHVIPQLGL